MPACLRRLVGLLHLAEDLGLADDHRIEAGRHAKGMADGSRPQPVEVRLELSRLAAVVRQERFRHGRGRGSSARP